jgi:RNA polymerase sigma factor (sigma-70 family)
MVEQRSDAQLVEACLAGDSRAWAELVQRYQRLVYTIAMRCGLPAEDAEDVFQRVFTILLTKLATCRNRERLGPWLTTITRREAWRVSQERQTARAEDGAEALEVRPTVEPPPDALLEQVEAQDLILRAMEQLGERCRLLLEQLFFTHEPPSYAEIAKKLSMPEGSIGPTRARCLERLREILKSMGYE